MQPKLLQYPGIPPKGPFKIYARANLGTLGFSFIELDQRYILLPAQTMLTVFAAVEIISRISNVNALQSQDVKAEPF